MDEPKLAKTEIDYTVTANGMIRVVAIRGVPGAARIKAMFGKEVVTDYLTGNPMYVASIRKNPLDKKSIACIKVGPVPGDLFFFEVGSLFEKEEFIELVSTLKKASSRLRKICKNVKNSRPKTIVI